MSLFRKPFSRRPPADDTFVDDSRSELSDGSLRYVVEKADNGSLPSYQDASGAPVERHSPLGYAVGPVTIVFVNISMMVGTGIYSTPSAVYAGTGSVGLSMIFWALGFFIALATLSVYLEFASYFPNRSGSETVYLEQAYPRPRWLFPTAFAFQSVALSFSSGNSIVLAQYLFKTAGHTPTAWQLKGVAVGGYTVATLFVVFHTRASYLVSNAIGAIKVLTLVFVAITGLVVLGGHTRVAHPKANFVDPFSGTATAYGATNALYRIIFSYAGYTNAFNMVNEIKNPVQQIRRNSFISLLVVAILYILANIAYFSAVPKAELAAAQQTAASLFFTHVFGDHRAVRGLNILIALSAFGNLVAVLLGVSRMLRECGRQGVLPFPRFWTSTRPFGTPLGPYLVKWSLTLLMILAPPAGDAFNFIADLQIYPSNFFNLLLVVGLLLVRWRRRRLHLPRPVFRAWTIATLFSILVSVYTLAMPWYPPPKGARGGDVSFWYGTYIVTGIGILVGCAVYYAVWVYVLPRAGGYRLRQELLVLDDGAQSHKLVKVPVAEVAAWDRAHDAVGRQRDSSDGGDGSGMRRLDETFNDTKRDVEL